MREDGKEKNGIIDIVVKKRWIGIWKNLSKKDKYMLLFGIGIAIILWNVSKENDKIGIIIPQEKEINDISQEIVARDVGFERNDLRMVGDISEYQGELEKRVEKILSKMEGVGNVSVLITLASDGNIIVEKDQSMDQTKDVTNDAAGGNQTKEVLEKQENTLMYENEVGKEVPYVRSRSMPQVQGIMIVCDGGDKIEVVVKITSAMEALFGIESHKIVIVKRNAG